jgi:hypothetical protein
MFITPIPGITQLILKVTQLLSPHLCQTPRNLTKQRVNMIFLSFHEPKIKYPKKGFSRLRTLYEYSILLQPLPLVSEYLLSLLAFVVDNMQKFQTNSGIHSINTRHKHDLHQLSANLTSYQKGACYAGIKLFSTLPDKIKSLNHDIKVCKPPLKDYLSCRSFYSAQKFTSTENYQIL